MWAKHVIEKQSKQTKKPTSGQNSWLIWFSDWKCMIETKTSIWWVGLRNHISTFLSAGIYRSFINLFRYLPTDQNNIQTFPIYLKVGFHWAVMTERTWWNKVPQNCLKICNATTFQVPFKKKLSQPMFVCTTCKTIFCLCTLFDFDLRSPWTTTFLPWKPLLHLWVNMLDYSFIKHNTVHI